MLTKCKSLPSNLDYFTCKVPEIRSFYNFDQLHLKGEQKLLTFGQYSEKKGLKHNRRKVIQYFYSKL